MTELAVLFVIYDPAPRRRDYLNSLKRCAASTSPVGRVSERADEKRDVGMRLGPRDFKHDGDFRIERFRLRLAEIISRGKRQAIVSGLQWRVGEQRAAAAVGVGDSRAEPLPRAAVRFFSSAAIEVVAGMLLSGMSIRVATPPEAAARVAVRKPSQSVRPGSLMWTCVSTRPGMTTESLAS